MAEKRPKRRRLRVGRILLLVLAVVVIVAAAVFLIRRLSPSKQVTDLRSYYNLNAALNGSRAEAAENELAIVLFDLPIQDSIYEPILEERAFSEGGQVYVPLTVLHDYVDERFYYDENEKVLVVTNAEQMIVAREGESGYSVNGAPESTNDPVLLERNGAAYVAMDFADRYSSAHARIGTEPARLVLTAAGGEMECRKVAKKTQVRVRGGIKSDLVGTIEEGDVVRVLDDQGDWIGVITSEGWLGYVKAKALGDAYKETAAGDYDEPEYTSLSTGKAIRLGWAGIYGTFGNEEFNNLTANAIGTMNVYCPTWYYLSDGEGNISSYADADYVDIAHQNGCLLWAMVGDADYDFVESVLTSTSKRTKLVDHLMDELEATGADGLNIDFERIMGDYGEDFIEFIRELSIRCRAAGKYLSVDNYPPYNYNACYHIEEQGRLCDYVIIMEYDDYLGSGQIGPNSSLPFVEEVTELSMEKVDPSKLVIAIPGYSRFWLQTEQGFATNEETRRLEYGTDAAWEQLSLDGASAVWDAKMGLDYAEYTLDGTYVYAWLESSESFRAKMDFLSGCGLAGIAVWQLGNEGTDIWDAIAEYY